MSKILSRVDEEWRRRCRQARFLLSAPHAGALPADGGIEIAFAGRSNAGKSSAINALTEQNQLARVSKTPGRTQALNFFELGEGARLVDLPGYGYAKVPAEMRKDWLKLIDGYFRDRQALRAVIIISDIRQALTDFDRQMLDYCRARVLPCLILLSKADKLNRGPALDSRRRILRELEAAGVPVEVVVFSAMDSTGLVETRRWMATQFDWPEPAA